MKIRVNERAVDVPDGTTVQDLRRRVKADADVLILNGTPVTGNPPLAEGDSVVLIRRGEMPTPEELEALMAARHTPGVHEKVKAAAVGIAGLGGLGSNVASALARVGVGRLVLADFDVVEPSNLNRQSYFVDQIGMSKVEATRDNLERINPYTVIETQQVRLDNSNIVDVFGRVDILVEAFDTAEGKAMLAQAYAAAFPDRPIVMASGLAGHASSNDIRTRKFGRNIYVVGDLVNAAAPGTGLMAPRVGVAAHHQANMVLRLLLGLDTDESEGTSR